MPLHRTSAIGTIPSPLHRVQGVVLRLIPAIAAGSLYLLTGSQPWIAAAAGLLVWPLFHSAQHLATSNVPAAYAEVGPYVVVLDDCGPATLDTVKALREMGHTFAAAKHLTEQTPSRILTGVSERAARSAVERLTAAGAKASFRTAEPPIPSPFA